MQASNKACFPTPSSGTNVGHSPPLLGEMRTLRGGETARETPACLPSLPIRGRPLPPALFRKAGDKDECRQALGRHFKHIFSHHSP